MDNLFTIHYNENGKVIGIELWHPIDGLWKHLYQDYTEDAKKYYTDGVGQFKTKDSITIPVSPQPKVIIHKNNKMKE